MSKLESLTTTQEDLAYMPRAVKGVNQGNRDMIKMVIDVEYEKVETSNSFNVKSLGWLGLASWA